MVSKITIFEPHFDGAQFGPRAIGGEEPAESIDESEAPDEDGGSRLRVLGALAIVALLAAVAYRTLRDAAPVVVEVDEVDESVTA